MPKKQREKKIWIKAMLELSNSSFADIARELKISRQAVQNTMIHASRRVELAIANKIGSKPEKIWPERYKFIEKSNKNKNTNGRRI